MPIRTRREMAERLQEVMSHAYTELEEKQRLEAETSLLKTYLLEAHSDKSGHGDIRALLRGAFGQAALGDKSEAHVRETDEEFFYSIDVAHRSFRRLWCFPLHLSFGGDPGTHGWPNAESIRTKC